nr:spike protein [Porcupine nidovirus 2]
MVIWPVLGVTYEFYDTPACTFGNSVYNIPTGYALVGTSEYTQVDADPRCFMLTADTYRWCWSLVEGVCTRKTCPPGGFDTPEACMTKCKPRMRFTPDCPTGYCILSDGSKFYDSIVPTFKKGTYTVLHLRAATTCENRKPPFIANVNGASAVVWNDTYTADPLFVSPEYTRLPTLGSCLDANGYYKYAGSLLVVSSAPPCFDVTTKVHDTIYYSNLNLYYLNFTCFDLCSGPCPLDYLASAQYQLCTSLISEIAKMGVQVRQSNFNITQPLHDFSIKIQKAANRSVPYNLTLNWTTPIVLPKFRPHFPNRGPDAIENFFNTNQDPIFNTYADLSSIAALPWLASWRFGRQINVLGYAAAELQQAVQSLVNVFNYNIAHIQNNLNDLTVNANHNYNSGGPFDSLATGITTGLGSLALDVWRNTKLIELSTMYTKFKVLAARHNPEQFEIALSECLTLTGSCSLHNSYSFFFSKINSTEVLYIMRNSSLPRPGVTSICVNKTAHVAPIGCVFHGVDLRNGSHACLEGVHILPSCDEQTVVTSMISALAAKSPVKFDIQPGTIDFVHLQSLKNFTDVVARKDYPVASVAPAWFIYLVISSCLILILLFSCCCCSRC